MKYDRKEFFDAVRPHFGSGRLTSEQVTGLDFILSVYERIHPSGSMKYLAYMLATTFWETAQTMQPIEEYGRGKGRRYHASGFWGRGYVQLTWDYNYTKATTELRKLGLIDETVSFTQKPDLVMKPEYAVMILIVGMEQGWFTGHKLETFFGGTKADPVNARRIINGNDKALQIAGIYRWFLAALLHSQQP